MSKKHHKKYDWAEIVSKEGFELLEAKGSDLYVKDSNGFNFKFYKWWFPPDKTRLIGSCLDKTEYFKFEMKDHPQKDTLDFSSVLYTGALNKVDISCMYHGALRVSPNDLKTGYGCRYCGRETTSKLLRKGTEAFISQATDVHSGKYDYSKVDYTNTKSKVTIICPEPGEFEQIAGDHANGRGCSECANLSRGFSRTSFVIAANKRGGLAKLYLILCSDDKEESFYKVGITCRELSERFTKSNFPYLYEVLYTIELPAEVVFDLEVKLSRMYYDYKYKPLKSFEGSTECFGLFEVDEFIRSVEKVVDEYYSIVYNKVLEQMAVN